MAPPGTERAGGDEADASPFDPPPATQAEAAAPAGRSAPFRPVVPPRGPVLPPVQRRPAPDFSIAMVNIVLLLVLFFLVAGTLTVEEEGRVDLPETRDLPLEALPRPLLLVAADGALTLDGVALPEAGLAAAVAGLARVHLLASREFPANRLLAIATEAAAGGAAVVLVTVRRAAPAGGGGP